MSTPIITVPIENRHISSTLMEKILSVDNKLVKEFHRLYAMEATGKGIKNVTVNSRGEMTFLPKGKKCIISTSTLTPAWKSDNRQSGSYGKVLRKLLIENGVDPKDISASELEEIVNSLKARYTVEGEFVVVSGSDISKYYLEENYDDDFNTGTMGSSCMRWEGACQKATKFYAENENCEMVILMSPDGDSSRGRALLWTDTEGRKFMDRIYANDHITEAFKMYAKSNGWFHKRVQDPCVGNWVTPDGEEASIDVEIEMNTDFKTRPYMDTFYFWKDGRIRNFDDEEGSIYYQKEPSDDDDDNTVYDEVDDCYIDVEDSVTTQEGYCTHYENVFDCYVSGLPYLRSNSVEINGELVYKECEDITWVESVGEYFFIEDTTYCQYNDMTFPSDEVEHVDDLGMDVKIEDIENAYEAAGWVTDEDGNWLQAQAELL